MARGKLGWRIARQPGNMDVAMASHRAPGAAVPPTVHTDPWPYSIVTVTGDTMQVEEATPLWTNRGVVPATGTGQWDQVRAAGRA